MGAARVCGASAEGRPPPAAQLPSRRYLRARVSAAGHGPSRPPPSGCPPPTRCRLRARAAALQRGRGAPRSHPPVPPTCVPAGDGLSRSRRPLPLPLRFRRASLCGRRCRQRRVAGSVPSPCPSRRALTPVGPAAGHGAAAGRKAPVRAGGRAGRGPSPTARLSGRARPRPPPPAAPASPGAPPPPARARCPRRGGAVRCGAALTRRRRSADSGTWPPRPPRRHRTAAEPAWRRDVTSGRAAPSASTRAGGCSAPRVAAVTLSRSCGCGAAPAPSCVGALLPLRDSVFTQHSASPCPPSPRCASAKAAPGMSRTRRGGGGRGPLGADSGAGCGGGRAAAGALAGGGAKGARTAPRGQRAASGIVPVRGSVNHGSPGAGRSPNGLKPGSD